MTRSKQEFYVGVSNPNVISDDFKRFEELENNFNAQIIELEFLRKNIDLEKIKFLDELLVLIKEFVDLKSSLPRISDSVLRKRLSNQKKMELAPRFIPKKTVLKPVANPFKKRVEIDESVTEKRKRSLELGRLRTYRKELEDLSKIVEKI